MRQLDDLKRKLVSKDDRREAAMRECKSQLDSLKSKVPRGMPNPNPDSPNANANANAD